MRWLFGSPTAAPGTTPTDLRLQLHKLRCLERTAAAPEAVEEALQSALEAIVAPSTLEHLLMEYANYCRRRLTAACASSGGTDEVVAWLQRLRGAFAFGLKFLDQIDPLWSRVAFFELYAHTEEEVIGDLISEEQRLAAVRSIWEECVATSPRSADSWLSYAASERRLGDYESERGVLRRAFGAIPTEEPGWGAVCAAWVLLERTSGDLDSVEELEMKMSVASAELSKKTQAAKRREDQAAAVERAPPASAPAKQPNKRLASTDDAAAPPVKRAKPAASVTAAASEPPVLPSKTKTRQEPLPPTGIFISNLPFEVSETDLRAIVEPAAPPGSITGALKHLNKAGKFRGMAVVSLAAPEAVEAALEVLGNEGMHLGRMLQFSATSASAKKEKTAKAEPGAAHLVPAFHATTVFAKGLASSVDDDDLASLFAEFGTVQTARILRDKNTKTSRCEGLVQFESGGEDAVTRALASSSTHFSVERSKFPAVLPQSAKQPRKSNPYLGGASTLVVSSTLAQSKAAQEEKKTTRPSFAFMPRSLKKK